MKRLCSILAIVLAGVAMTARPVDAGPVLAITNVVDSGFTVNNTYGYSFTALADLTATDLGIFDLNLGTLVIGDGLLEPHLVGLWKADGTLLSSVIVPPGGAGTLVGGFRYAPIAPISLQSGETYVVAAHYASGTIGDAYTLTGFATFTWDPLIAPVDGRRFDNGFGFPTVNLRDFFAGPNVIVTSAPEPGTLVLLGLGFAGAVSRRFRQR